MVYSGAESLDSVMDRIEFAFGIILMEQTEFVVIAIS